MAPDAVNTVADQATVVCAIVLKNERWILGDFLTAASEWADVIVVADNGSSDGSVEIATAFEKVRLINVGDDFNEFRRRKAVIDAARQVPGKRLIIGLDADEMLSATWRTSAEWQHMLGSPAGTLFHLDWVFALPGLCECISPSQLPFALVDDGTPYKAPPIHSPRVPINTSGHVETMREIKVLHFAFLDLDRVLAKHRFYQCIESVYRSRTPFELCIEYFGPRFTTYGQPLIPLHQELLAGLPIPETAPDRDGVYWHDDRALEMLVEYGAATFRKADIWSKDWAELARLRGYPPVTDPRTPVERMVHSMIDRNRDWLTRPTTLPQRAVRKALRLIAPLLAW